MVYLRRRQGSGGDTRRRKLSDGMGGTARNRWEQPAALPSSADGKPDAVAQSDGVTRAERVSAAGGGHGAGAFAACAGRQSVADMDNGKNGTDAGGDTEDRRISPAVPGHDAAAVTTSIRIYASAPRLRGGAADDHRGRSGCALSVSNRKPQPAAAGERRST